MFSKKSRLFFGIVISLFLFLVFFNISAFALLALTNDLNSWTSSSVSKDIEKVNWFTERYRYNPFFGLEERVDQHNHYVGSEVRFRVAIVGGSFARGVARSLFRAIHGSTKKLPFDIEKIGISNLAVGSGKQPQQLVRTLLEIENYDLIISIEGYNEIFVSHNSCRPLGWPLITAFVDPDLPQGFKRRNERIRRVLNFFAENQNNWATFKLLHKVISPWLLKRFHDNTKAYRQNQSDRCPELKQDDHLTDLVNIWVSSARKHQKLVQGFGKKIYTVIQPQQYLSKKPISKEEREIFSARSETNQNEMGEKYQRAIDTFVGQFQGSETIIDSTEVFSGDTQTLYKDANCHLNKEGYDLYMERVILPILAQEYLAD